MITALCQADAIILRSISDIPFIKTTTIKLPCEITPIFDNPIDVTIELLQGQPAEIA
jgi:hypothetical protein